jgi:hypothetical protein
MAGTDNRSVEDLNVQAEQLDSRDSMMSEDGERLEIHVDNLREELKTCLSTSTAESRSTFMHQDTRESYPNPGLKIRDFRTVGLPLSPQDIDTIKQAGHRSPSGTHGDTTTDSNVKQPSQIQAADLVCSNPR